MRLSLLASVGPLQVVTDQREVPEHLHKAAATNVVLHLLNLEAGGAVTGERQAPLEALTLGGKTTPSELTDLFKTVAPNITARFKIINLGTSRPS